MSTTTATRKPRKWRKRTDGRCCIACEKPFVRGDMVYEDCVVCLHEGCLGLYRNQLIELGLLKPAKTKGQTP